MSAVKQVGTVPSPSRLMHAWNGSRHFFSKDQRVACALDTVFDHGSLDVPRRVRFMSGLPGLGVDHDDYLPPGCHAFTPEELRAVFVTGRADEAHRETLLQQWVTHRRAIADMVPVFDQWVDGSFVTGKVQPKDVDVITIIDSVVYDGLLSHRQEVLRALHRGHQTRDALGVDAFLLIRYPEGTPGYVTWIQSHASWTWQWSRVRGRVDRWKGFAEVKYGR